MGMNTLSPPMLETVHRLYGVTPHGHTVYTVNTDDPETMDHYRALWNGMGLLFLSEPLRRYHAVTPSGHWMDSTGPVDESSGAYYRSLCYLSGWLCLSESAR